MLDIQARHPAARSDAHVRKLEAPLAEFGAIPDIEKDHFLVVKGKPGQPIAVGTKGVAACVTILGRGHTESNEPVVGLAHLSSLADPEEAWQAMRAAFETAGAAHVDFHLVGGILSRGEGDDSWLDLADDLLVAASELKIDVSSVKLGISQTDPREHGKDVVLLPSFGLPLKVSVVVMPEGVVYCDESARNPNILRRQQPLFVSSAERGLPISEE